MMLTKIQRVVKTEIESNRWHFLLVVLAMYLIIAFYNWQIVVDSFLDAGGIFVKIIPIFLLVFVIMVALNYYIKPQIVKKYLDKTSGWKKWPIAIGAGVISTGPIYMWYPMLKDLREHGVSEGVIAAFLYSRAIKPFLLPVMGFYFGWEYVIVLTVLMVVFSWLQGLIVEEIFIDKN